MDKIFIFGIIILVAVILGGIALNERSKPQNLQPIGDKFELQPANHIPPQGEHPAYNSNPPSSGWHWPQPADWGIYDKELPDEQLVHNLEHGGVNVFYKPDAPQELVNKLKERVRPYPRKTVLAPRSKNETLIALASWGYVLKLDTFDESKIREFLKNNRNRGPEQFPD